MILNKDVIVCKDIARCDSLGLKINVPCAITDTDQVSLGLHRFFYILLFLNSYP